MESDPMMSPDWCATLGMSDVDVVEGPHRVRAHIGGSGPTIVLLHGNPTYSYLWRAVLPALLPHFRCLAIDLAGFGSSSTQHDLGVADHASIVTGVVRQLTDDQQLTWLTHDWGVAIGFTAVAAMSERRHAVAFGEGHIRWIPAWSEADPGMAQLFSMLRLDPEGRDFVEVRNDFIESVLLGSLGGLTDEERAAYRSPFDDPRRRRAILMLCRSVPVGGEPTELGAVLTTVDGCLADPALPKLLLYGSPGAVIDVDTRRWLDSHATNLKSVPVGPSGHFIPEDQPEAIARAVIAWHQDRR